MRSVRSIIFVTAFLVLPADGVAQWQGAAPTQRRQPAIAARSDVTPHPAVCRIITPERDGVAYGSGTLIAVEGEYGLVVTNWHVVSEAADSVTVTFPDGFQSGARVLDTDKDWDLAALLIWKPNASPVKIARDTPQRNDLLKIAGYGSGRYRELIGRCTQYVSPGMDLPFEMVELTGEARQGDSGGPIFNEHGELAGVLFGAGEGTTAGSYAGRVSQFLTSVIRNTPDPEKELIAAVETEPATPPQIASVPETRSDLATGGEHQVNVAPLPATTPSLNHTPANPQAPTRKHTWESLIGTTPLDHLRSLLAMIGLVALFAKMWRWLD